MKSLVLLLLCLAACQGFGPADDESNVDSGDGGPADKPAAPVAPPPEPLPDKFDVLGSPTVEAAYLGPREAWRQLRSRLTTLQADARRWDRDLLVSFEPGAVHWTGRNGARTTWELPKGLLLSVVTPHVVVRKDLTLVGFREDGTQIASQEELTVANVSWTQGSKGKSESRLIVKGGKAFRSITPR